MAIEPCQEQLSSIPGGSSMSDSKQEKACDCALDKVSEEVGDELDAWLGTYVAAWEAQKQGNVDQINGGRIALSTMSWHVKDCTGL